MSEPELTCDEKLEAANDRINELEQALRKEITFRTAREMQGRDIWLPVMDVIDIFHKTYQLRNTAINKDKRHTKILFTISNEGRVIDVSSREPAEQAADDKEPQEEEL